MTLRMGEARLEKGFHVIGDVLILWKPLRGEGTFQMQVGKVPQWRRALN